ncbi:MAG TPA: SDR family oxidoreductase [Puia sp.]|nr:SDR family oxidoreductase [Puia sp.]
MKVFITGANGLLGQHLVKLLLDNNYSVIASGKGPSRLLFQENDRYKYYPVDITIVSEIEDVLSLEKPDIFIHTAAMTQVDTCEQQRDECFNINVNGTANMIKSAEINCHHFIYISTDFVFDGRKGNYSEEDHCSSVNWYGSTKIKAEELVKECKIPRTIIRTCLVYGNTIGGTRNNIISWVKDKLEKKEKIKVVDDQVRTPTYVEDLARGIMLIMGKKAEGIFHISGKDIMTPYSMALQAADFFSLDKNLIEKADASTFTQTARRPLKTGFIIDKARRELGFEPVSFSEGLRRMLGV